MLKPGKAGRVFVLNTSASILPTSTTSVGTPSSSAGTKSLLPTSDFRRFSSTERNDRPFLGRLARFDFVAFGHSDDAVEREQRGFV